MYAVTYKTQRGGSGVMKTPEYVLAEKKIVSCFKRRLEAKAFHNGKEIGRVWKDNSQRTGWNFQIAQPE